MKIEEMTLIIEALKAVFPHHFPKDEKGITALVLVWMNDLGHFPGDMLKDAAQYLRSHEDFPTIAAMFRAIKAICGVPTMGEIRANLDSVINGDQVLKLDNLHPIGRKIFDNLGGYQGIVSMSATSFDIAFQREFAIAQTEWYDTAIQPGNIKMLVGHEKQIEQ